MGIIFSKLHGDNSIPPGAYTAGDAASLNSSTIKPYLGYNTGSYSGIPIDNLPPIPFEWIVSPSTVMGTCPNASQVLTMFAVTEAVIVLLTPLVAYRPFVHWLSRGRLGRRRKNSPLWTWAVVFACGLLANAAVAAIIGHSPGYGHLNMLHVFVVFLGRPRFHLVVLGVLRIVVAVARPRDMDKTRVVSRRLDNGTEFPYTDAYVAVALSELLMLVVAAVFTGVTWHRVPSASLARELLDTTVRFVSSTPGVMLVVVLAFVPAYKRYGEAFPAEGRRYDLGRRWGVSVAADGTARVGVKRKTMGASRARWMRVANAAAGGCMLGFVTLVQWAYWTAFLRMPGCLFCMTGMVEGGVVWVLFTVAGMLVGEEVCLLLI